MSLKSGLDVMEKVKEFGKVINDLEYFGYDPDLLLNQLSDKITLANEQKTLLDDNTHYLMRQENLKNENADLRTQNSKNSQILSVVRELKLMGFGLHDLKQLKFAVVEIAEANNISADLAVSKFLKDVEKNYDNKLWLENKVNEIKDTICNLENKIAHKLIILRLHPKLGPALSRLIQHGMGMEEIMGIHDLVQSLKERPFSFDDDHEIDKKSSKYTNNNNTDGTYFLTPLTNELKKYGGIKLAIKAQSEKLEELGRRINVLGRQRQDLIAYIKGARYAINSANSVVLNSKKIIDNFAEYSKGSIIVNYFLYLPLHVYLIGHSTAVKRKGKKEKTQKGKIRAIKGLRNSVV